jgi:hypothetical protein
MSLAKTSDFCNSPETQLETKQNGTNAYLDGKHSTPAIDFNQKALQTNFHDTHSGDYYLFIFSQFEHKSYL